MFHAKHLGRAQVPRAEKSHADGPGARGPGARVRRSRGSDGNAGSLGVAVRFPAFRSALVEASLQRVGIEPVARILSPELGHEPS